MIIKIAISAEDLESEIENYLKKMFGKPVVWYDADLAKILVTVEEYEDGTDLPEEFEDEWDK